MTRVDFYLLKGQQTVARYRAACRLTEKAFSQQFKIHIHTGSAQESQQLDDLLWTFREGSFLPHEIVKSNQQTPGSPISISHEWEPQMDCQVLINLGEKIPPFFSRFDRVAEFLNEDETIRQKGREHWRFYKDRGYPLQHHEVKR